MAKDLTKINKQCLRGKKVVFFPNKIVKRKPKEYGIREVQNADKANHLPYEVFLIAEMVTNTKPDLKVVADEIMEFLSSRSGSCKIVKCNKLYTRYKIKKLVQRVRFEHESDVMVFSILFSNVIQKIFHYV